MGRNYLGQATKCLRCGATFHARPVRVRTGAAKYCSVACKAEAARKPEGRGPYVGKIERPCAHCGATLRLFPNQVKRGKRFCGTDCYRASQRQPRTEKACSNCGTVKRLDEFYGNPNMALGRTSRCKVCIRADVLAYRAARPEQTTAWKQQWARSENGIKYGKAYRHRHRDRRLAAMRAWYQAHREEQLARKRERGPLMREARRAYYLARRDHQRAQFRRWYEANRERDRANGRRWSKENRDKARAIWMRRRARKLAAFRADVIPTVIFERDRWRCGICGKRVRRRDASIDHVIPLAKGGTHEPGNVQCAHLLCNIRKGARLPLQPALPLE